VAVAHAVAGAEPTVGVPKWADDFLAAWYHAYNAGNAEAVSSFFEQDATLGEDRGRRAIAASLTRAFSSASYQCQGHFEAFRQVGNTAVAWDRRLRPDIEGNGCVRQNEGALARGLRAAGQRKVAGLAPDVGRTEAMTQRVDRIRRNHSEGRRASSDDCGTNAESSFLRDIVGWGCRYGSNFQVEKR